MVVNDCDPSTERGVFGSEGFAVEAEKSKCTVIFSNIMEFEAYLDYKRDSVNQLS